MIEPWSSRLVAAVLLLRLVLIAPTTHALPAGFVDEHVVSSRLTTDLAFASSQDTPLLLITERTGILWLLQDFDHNQKPTMAANLTQQVCTRGGRGLLSVAVHPNFAVNRWVYLFYSATQTGLCIWPGPVLSLQTRVSRFVLTENNTLDLATERVLIQTPRPPTNDHVGGSMEFGPDGHLYVSMGNGMYPQRSFRGEQKLNNFLGTVVRITDDGSIPNDNPFVDHTNAQPCGTRGRVSQNAICSEIYMYGLRNPFRIAMDHNSVDKTRFFVNDVGADVWEEITENKAGANLGWPDREGPCLANTDDECTPDPSFHDPTFWYRHGADRACITAGAFVPNGVWPYNDSYIYVDYMHATLHMITPSSGRRNCYLPQPAYTQQLFHEWPSVLVLKFGPYQQTQALYYANQYWDVRRIVYVGGGA